MVAVAQNFTPVRYRDDLALELAASTLSKALLEDIREPGIDYGKDDFNRTLDEQARIEASAFAQALANSLKQARELSAVQAPRAIAILQSQLGGRLPNQPSWVEVDSSGDDIRRVPAATVPPPMVGATNAG